MIKVAIVGCGLIATEKYIPIFKKLNSRAKIIGICDLNEDVLKRAATTWKIDNAYKDFLTMLSEQTPDLVVICTPPKTHASLAIEAMKNGSHVLVEKPMATSVAECDSMIDAVTQYGRKLGVMHNQLFNPAFEAARQLVSSHSVGRFLGIRVFLATSIDYMTSNPNHWAHRLPGGVVGETGPHAVYLSLAFLNNIKDVQVRYKKLFPEYPWSIAEDIRIDLIADNGMSSITLAYGSTQTTAEVDIICTDALLKVDLQSRTLVVHKRPGLGAGTIGKSVVSTVYQMSRALVLNTFRYAFSRDLDSHYQGVRRFLDYIEGNVEYPITGEEGKRNIAVMEMIVQRMQENAEV
jgi:predicted dehydrogenase